MTEPYLKLVGLEPEQQQEVRGIFDSYVEWLKGNELGLTEEQIKEVVGEELHYWFSETFGDEGEPCEDESRYHEASQN